MKKTTDEKNVLRALFSEARIKIGERVMVAREADFKHRRGINKRALMQMKENFDKNVIGLQIDFDYSHKEDPAKGQKAAGWIKSLEFGETEVGGVKYAALFAVPEWTPEASKAIEDREYQYVSPEIFWEWTHPESGEKFTNVLRSVAILNRPQLTGQPSIKLSEAEIPKKEEFKVDKLKEFAEKELGAKFTEKEVTEDMIVSAFSAKLAAHSELVAKKDADIKSLNDKYSALESTKSEAEKEMSKFKEELEQIKKDAYAEKVKSIVEEAKESKLSPAEADGWFKELADKDIDLAKKALKDMPDRISKSAKMTEKKVDAGTIEAEEKEIEAKMKEIATERGCKLSEVTFREAADRYYSERKVK